MYIQIEVKLRLTVTSQALHNIPENPDRWDIRDPGLTPIGIWQCKKLRAILPANRNIRSIFYSPMIRTIDTTLIVFKDEIESGKIPNTAWWSLRGKRMNIQCHMQYAHQLTISQNGAQEALQQVLHFNYFRKDMATN